MLEHIHLPLHRMRDENEPGSPLHHLAKSLASEQDRSHNLGASGERWYLSGSGHHDESIKTEKAELPAKAAGLHGKVPRVMNQLDEIQISIRPSVATCLCARKFD